MRLFLVGLKIGISKSLETGQDTRASPGDETVTIPVGDGDPVISSNHSVLIAHLPSSVRSFLKTKIKGVEGAGIYLSGEVNISPFPEHKATPELLRWWYVQKTGGGGNGPREPTLGCQDDGTD